MCLSVVLRVYTVGKVSELTAAERGYALKFSGNLPISIGIDAPAAGKGLASFVNRIVRNAGRDDDIPDDYLRCNTVLGYDKHDATYYLVASRAINVGEVLVTLYGSGGQRFG